MKNILFDLGGVLFDLDISRTEKGFKKLLGEEFDLAFYKSGMDDVFKKFETGAVTKEEFVAKIQSWGSTPITFDQVKDAWNAMLLGIPHHRFQLLQELSKKYNLYLLSNINAFHLEWFRKDLLKRHLIENFDEFYFKKAYYSHLIERRKPDVATYEFVLNDAGITAAETLFIDDNAANIEGAKKAGLQTMLHDPKKEIFVELKV